MLSKTSSFEEFFEVLIRNPYSTGHYDSDTWVKYAQYQKYNIENLNNTICISYEECCTDLEKVISKITKKIPGVGKIFNNDNPKINNERGNMIHTNKVNRVINKESKNEILKGNVDLVEYFGYSIIE